MNIISHYSRFFFVCLRLSYALDWFRVHLCSKTSVASIPSTDWSVGALRSVRTFGIDVFRYCTVTADAKIKTANK